jgi:hypothetical protein
LEEASLVRPKGWRGRFAFQAISRKHQYIVQKENLFMITMKKSNYNGTESHRMQELHGLPLASLKAVQELFMVDFLITAALYAYLDVRCQAIATLWSCKRKFAFSSLIMSIGTALFLLSHTFHFHSIMAMGRHSANGLWALESFLWFMKRSVSGIRWNELLDMVLHFWNLDLVSCNISLMQIGGQYTIVSPRLLLSKIGKPKPDSSSFPG